MSLVFENDGIYINIITSIIFKSSTILCSKVTGHLIHTMHPRQALLFCELLAQRVIWNSKLLFISPRPVYMYPCGKY